MVPSPLLNETLPSLTIIVFNFITIIEVID